MPLNPGNQTLTFNPPDAFVVDRLHTVPASSGLSPFTQVGCNLQPVTVKDKIDNTTYSDATDKAFTPYNTSIGVVDAEWYLQDSNGDNYRILGAHNVADGRGRIYQGMFICKKESG